MQSLKVRACLACSRRQGGWRGWGRVSEDVRAGRRWRARSQRARRLCTVRASSPSHLNTTESHWKALSVTAMGSALYSKRSLPLLC